MTIFILMMKKKHIKINEIYSKILFKNLNLKKLIFFYLNFI